MPLIINQSFFLDMETAVGSIYIIVFNVRFKSNGNSTELRSGLAFDSVAGAGSFRINLTWRWICKHHRRCRWRWSELVKAWWIQCWECKHQQSLVTANLRAWIRAAALNCLSAVWRADLQNAGRFGVVTGGRLFETRTLAVRKEKEDVEKCSVHFAEQSVRCLSVTNSIELPYSL